MQNSLRLTVFQFNDFAENTYIIYHPEGDAFIVDPGPHSPQEWEQLRCFIDQQKCNPKAIIATHAHLDHVFAVELCRRQWHAPFMLHADDSQVLQESPLLAKMWGVPMEPIAPPDALLSDGQRLRLGDQDIEIIHTPGHSPGGVCLLIKGDQHVLIAGDTLFAGSIGRTDLPGGSYAQLIQSIKERLFSLPDDTVVLPGHGPKTTIGHERRNNPFLR